MVVTNLQRCGAQGAEPDFTLSILHLNDVHARFEQTNVYSGRCTPGDEQKNRCYGGFARIHTAVKNLRAELPNSLFLAAGDYFQGTVWYTVHRYKAMAHFLNIISHDAMSLGNHEFDDGVPNLVHFLENASFPVLAANINDEREPTIQGKYAKSVVVEKSGRLIGIIGYLTTETLRIANTGKLDVTDEITAVREEARRLLKEGVQIIIALGHAGYRKDVELAMQVEEVDVVVGGHTNTFLYTGDDPSTEVSVDQYPSVITQASGRQVPVVQAYAFGKYLGRLDVTFDANGEVVSWTGNPILLDNSIVRDPFILSELQPWKIQINSIVAEEIGKTFVFLDGNRLSCRMRECNLGNLETDAVIHLNAKFPDDMEWARTSLAVINGGGIRSSIDERASNGSITMEDILTVAPFQNTIDIVELRGRDVRAMFEHSVEAYDPMALDPGGRFLQVSGFVVVYDITKPPGSRVVRLQARCVSCRVPTMEDVQDEDIYKIAMPSFIANGGDGYTVVRDQKIQHHLTGLLDTDVYSQYIQMVSPIYQGIENRILFIDSSSVCSGPSEPPQLASDGDLQQLGEPDEGFPLDTVAEAGPAHNPFLIAPHDMVNEMMSRHDIYFRKYYEKKLKKEKKRLLAEQNSLKAATRNLQERLEEIRKHELKVKLHEQILQGLDHLQDINSALTVVHAPIQIEEQAIQPIRGGTNVLPAPTSVAQNFGSLEFFPSGLRGATVTTLPGTRLEVGSPVRPSPEVLVNVMDRDVSQKARTDAAAHFGITQDQEIISPSVREAQLTRFPNALTKVKQIDLGSQIFDFDVINLGDRVLG